MKDYIEERAISIANYIIDSNATVRQTAKAFGGSKYIISTNSTVRAAAKEFKVSKSTVHMVVTK